MWLSWNFILLTRQKKLAKVLSILIETMEINGNRSLAFIDHENRAILVRQSILIGLICLLTVQGSFKVILVIFF